MEWTRGAWEDDVAVEKLREYLRENGFSTITGEMSLGWMIKSLLVHLENTKGMHIKDKKFLEDRVDYYRKKLETVKRAFRIISE